MFLSLIYLYIFKSYGSINMVDPDYNMLLRCLRYGVDQPFRGPCHFDRKKQVMNAGLNAEHYHFKYNSIFWYEIPDAKWHKSGGCEKILAQDEELSKTFKYIAGIFLQQSFYHQFNVKLWIYKNAIIFSRGETCFHCHIKDKYPMVISA